MLSGDNQEIADAIGNTLELDASYGELLPADKVNHLEKSRNLIAQTVPLFSSETVSMTPPS